jgi:hypothetical protein
MPLVLPAPGLDLNKAKESVLLVGELLEANCQQVGYLDEVIIPDPVRMLTAT